MDDTEYCYPNSDILINRLGIKDAALLHNAERDITSRRLIQLYDCPVSGRFGYTHLKRIHKYIFQDIYSWAGEERKVDIAKGNMFCNVLFIPEQAEIIFSDLLKEKLLQGLSQKDFSDKVAYYISEINALHPFREGNGRSQREYIRELALHAGHKIDYSNITENEMVSASINSFTKNYEPMILLMRKAVVL